VDHFVLRVHTLHSQKQAPCAPIFFMVARLIRKNGVVEYLEAENSRKTGCVSSCSAAIA
jgi:hypothetical protein